MSNDENFYEDAQKAVAHLRELRTEIREIEGIIQTEHPDMWERYGECHGECKAATDTVKVLMRKLGPGRHDLAGVRVEVRKPPEKLHCDVEGLLDRAQDRGDLQELIDAGVLAYQVVPHQIARLTGKQKAIYSGYLTKESGTPSVVLPRDLK
jgi:hypothetical protein